MKCKPAPPCPPPPAPLARLWSPQTLRKKGFNGCNSPEPDGDDSIDQSPLTEDKYRKTDDLDSLFKRYGVSTTTPPPPALTCALLLLLSSVSLFHFLSPLLHFLLFSSSSPFSSYPCSSCSSSVVDLKALNKKEHRDSESPEPEEPFSLTPRTEEKYKKIDEEFDKMMQNYRLSVSTAPRPSPNTAPCWPRCFLATHRASPSHRPLSLSLHALSPLLNPHLRHPAHHNLLASH